MDGGGGVKWAPLLKAPLDAQNAFLKSNLWVTPETTLDPYFLGKLFTKVPVAHGSVMVHFCHAITPSLFTPC